MKYFIKLFFTASFFYLFSCTIKKEEDRQDSINAELTRIDSLLRDTNYNASMAQTLEAAYYKAAGEAVPAFLAAGEDTATKRKSLKEEIIATNIAGFYALECGVELLTFQTHKTPVDLLTQIVNNSLDSSAINILNRFANAAWKTGQPFRDLKRIERPIFMVFNFLPAIEVKKDYDMYQAAAAKLLPEMQDVKDSSITAQLQKIHDLMQNENFTIAMADSLHIGYYVQQQQKAPPLLTPQDDTATVIKSVKNEKIAANVAGFYALECGLNYFAAKDRPPSKVLQSIVNGTISNDDKNLLERFANVTWKASQPFRGLSRIQRDNFIPFYFLSEPEIEKDWVQIKAAAEKLLKDINGEKPNL